MDVILLAHQAGVLEGPAPGESAVPGKRGWPVKGPGVLTITWTAGCASAAAGEGGQGTLSHSLESRGRGGAGVLSCSVSPLCQQAFVSN